MAKSAKPTPVPPPEPKPKAKRPRRERPPSAITKYEDNQRELWNAT